jgi:hypothetical protein
MIGRLATLAARKESDPSKWNPRPCEIPAQLAPALPFVRAVGTLHPLVSFADARVAVDAMKEVAFGVEGDEPARAMAKRIVRALGARAVFLEAENLALYHAGAVIASNYVVAMADTAQTLLVRAGVPPDQALRVDPLLRSVVQPAQLGLPGALTGPVERGTSRRRASPQDAGARARAAGALSAGRLRRCAGAQKTGWTSRRGLDAVQGGSGNGKPTVSADGSDRRRPLDAEMATSGA